MRLWISKKVMKWGDVLGKDMKWAKDFVTSREEQLLVVVLKPDSRSRWSVVKLKEEVGRVKRNICQTG